MDSKKTKDTSALREIYYDKRIGLGGFSAIWEAAKERKLGFTQKEVKAFMARQKASQVTKDFKKPKKFTTIRAPKAGTNLQIDQMFFDKPKIKGTAGVLNVVDVHSRAMPSPCPSRTRARRWSSRRLRRF